MIGNAQERLTSLFRERLPQGRSVWGVYAVIVFLVYSWTLFTSFYKLPSWMFYLTIDQILSIYAYSFSVDLVESILLLIGIIFLEFTLFLGLKNKDEFQSRSVLMVLVLLASLMARLMIFQGYEDSVAFVSGELLWWGITIPLVFLAAIIGSKIMWLRNVIDGISDRVVVFLYIYLPLSFLGLVVVIIRNIV